jgi:four helix bundle protein
MPLEGRARGGVRLGRNHERLTVFHKADELAVLVYRLTKDFPSDERFGLRSQLRRAAVSVPANIVEGAARQGRRDYVRFLDIALGSAAETAYLLHLSGRLGFVGSGEMMEGKNCADSVSRMLQKLIVAIRSMSDEVGPRR